MTGFAINARHRWIAELVIAVAIFTAGACVGASYQRTFAESGAPQAYGQPEFGAAVALACGHGFADPGYGFTPALDDFLHVKSDTYSCADLPATLPLRLPNLTQGLYRYLMTAVAVVWRVRGRVSWSGLTPLFGAMYGITLVAAYALFRILVGRLSALAATFALTISAIHLGALPQLRDYAKAPFILALMLIMGLMVQRPLRPRRAIALALTFGLTLGIGFGFRNDLLINLLPWTAVVLFCLPGTILSNARLKVTCLAISGAMFVIASWPILTAYSRGSNSGHVAFLGLMSSFDVPLGIDEPIYSWGYVYSDEFAATIVNSFSQRVYGHAVAFLSPEYDKAMVAYLLRIARHWPADMATRMYASVLKMLEMPYFVGGYTNPSPYGLVSPRLKIFYEHQQDVLKSLYGWGVYAAAAALLVIGATDVRTALTLLLFLVYFAGYPALQFNVRHFFHLEFIGWGALAFLLDRILSSPSLMWRSRREWLRRNFWVAVWHSCRLMTRNAAVVAGTAIILIAGPIAVLRAYQTAHVRGLFAEQYLGPKREPLSIVQSSAAGGRVSITIPELWRSRNSRENVSTEYLAIELSPRACDALFVPITFHYDAAKTMGDFSHATNVPLGDGDQPTVVLSPVYYGELSHFDRIELPAEDASCVASVSKISAREIPEVLVDANFTPRWRDEPLFQSIRGWESPERLESLPAMYLSPASIVPPRRLQLRPFVAPSGGQYFAPIVKATPDGGLTIKGQPDAPLSYIVMIKEQPLAAGSMLVARGFVRKGGITVGLLRNGQWANSINIAASGPFIAALALDATATYSVVVANFVKSGQNDVVISALGWVPPR